MDQGMREMLERQADVFYYLTVTNENYPQPSLPEGAAGGIIKGMYRLCARGPADAAGRVRLLGSGAILRECIAAAELLARDWNIASEIWSVTSYGELAREARACERDSRHRPLQPARRSYVAECLGGPAPVVAASDYVRALPQMIASCVEAPFTALGTDGFGRSDTRETLRRFFEVDRREIALAALASLAAQSSIGSDVVAEAVGRYGIDAARPAPWVS
jgi:pyruvate dehydrogenase E1 component